MLEGAIRSQVNDGPVTTYEAGQSFLGLPRAATTMMRATVSARFGRPVPTLYAAPAEDFRRRGGLAFAQYDHRFDRLPPKAVGDAHHTDLLHRFMPHDDLLDLGRIDVLPTGLDQISFAVDICHRAIRLAAEQIAGVKPSAGENFLIGLGVVQIAAHDTRPPHDAFARLTHGHVIHRVIDDADIEQGRWLFPQTWRLARTGETVCDKVGCLSLAKSVIEFDPAGRGQLRDDIRHHIGVAAGEAQARQIVVAPARMVEKLGDDAGQQEGPAQPITLDHAEHRLDSGLA